MKKLYLLLIVILFTIETFSATIDAGTYSVKSGGDYNTLSSAISALNTNGISGNGNVIFEIGDNQSLSELTINDISGADASSQIFFRAEAGTNPVITFNLSASGNSGILFNGTDYVTFDGWDQQGNTNRDITFKLSGNYGKIFEFKDATDCENITIKNLNLIGYSNTVDMENSSIFYEDSSDDDFEISHISITNNYIYKFANGIRIKAKLSDDNNYIDIKNNSIGPLSASSTNNITYSGITVRESKYVNIIGNEIQNIQYTSGSNELYGIWVETIDSLICDTNNIHDITANKYAWGIKIRAFWPSVSHGYRIAKNIITDVYTQSSGAAGTDAAGICYSLLYSNGLIDNNKIYNIYTQRASASPAGIGTWAVGALKNITISKNKIYRIYNATNADDSQTIYSGRGIYFNGTLVENVQIVNNFIYAIGGGSNRSTSAYGSGDFNETYPFGIMINTSSAVGSSPQIKIYHNSVYMTEDAKTNATETGYPLNSATSCFAGAIGINTSRTNFIDMRNNIFYNTISPVHTNQFKPQYAVMLYQTTNPFTNSDYNIYKMERQLHSIWCKQYNYVAAVGGGTTSYAKPLSDNTCNGGAGSTSYGSGCADWQEFTGDDAHSINHNITFACSGGLNPTILSDDIIFIGTDDLHVDLADIIAGTNLGVTEDGDSDPRTNPYSIGADQGGGNLPIVLSEFIAKLSSQNIVNLQWTTLTEINNDYFIVERSKDTKKWETVEILKGAGNSTNIIFYNTKDFKPYNGVSYYRLKQIDFDGQFNYSKTVSINLDDANSSKTLIYPNPTNNKITIEGSELELQQVRIYNMQGQDVTNQVLISKDSNKKITIDLSKLSKGTYLVKTKTTIANVIYK